MRVEAALCGMRDRMFSPFSAFSSECFLECRFFHSAFKKSLYKQLARLDQHSTSLGTPLLLTMASVSSSQSLESPLTHPPNSALNPHKCAAVTGKRQLGAGGGDTGQ